MKISIPQPCHENWNEMLPDEKGRFCQSCQKCVIDFTKLPDDEILKILKMPNQCGRFSTNQLEEINRKLKEEKQIRFPSFFRYSTLMIGLGLGGTIIAQEKEKTEIVESKTNHTNHIKSDTITVRSTVTDSDGFPISDAFVKLQNNNIETYTDENGYFEMLIPNGNFKDIITIEDSFGNSKNYCVDEINNKEFVFNSYSEGELMVVGLIRERTFTGKVFHTLSWPFRQIGKIF